MNRIKREGIIALALLIVCLTACEKDVLNGTEGQITVNFTLSDLSYGEDEVRSAPVRMEPETVIAPVEGDLYAYATLEEEEESPLRASGGTLDVGTRVRVVAYTSANAYVNSCEYTITNATTGAIQPVGATTGLTLTTSGSYKFVAYSFNTTTVPGYATSITGSYSPNANASDPLWGISGTSNLTEGGSYNISIIMKHQFSRVAFKATTAELSGTPNIVTISATLAGYQATEMTVLTGALTKGAAEDQPFASFSPLNSNTVTSAARMVYAGGESTTSIKISSIQIGTATGGIAAPIRFNQKLDPGKSYTLRVSFKTLRWAGSNIYWDEISDPSNPKLTFDPAGTTTNQGYQGVFFKFGSLVGVSPALVGTEDYFADQAVPIYVPYGYPSTPKWRGSTSIAEGYTTWAKNSSLATDIPYLDPTYQANAWGRNSTFVIDADRNDATTYQSLRGDICQYLSKTGAVSGNYRLPTANEFGTANTFHSWQNSSTSPDDWRLGSGTFTEYLGAGYPNGRADLLSNRRSDSFDPDRHTHGVNTTVLGSISNPTKNVTLPAPGIRNFTTGNLDLVGIYGYYWSGSVYNSSELGYMLSFHYGTLNPAANYSRSACLPIRCVHN